MPVDVLIIFLYACFAGLKELEVIFAFCKLFIKFLHLKATNEMKQLHGFCLLYVWESVCGLTLYNHALNFSKSHFIWQKFCKFYLSNRNSLDILTIGLQQTILVISEYI